MPAFVECVPNFSEGRNPATIRAIADAIAACPGVVVLDQTSDADHNRSVVTFAGPPTTILEAALEGIACAVERIDINRHVGVHPRLGAVDVVPFVPVSEVTLEDCARIAVDAATAIWRRLRIPVFLYEAAARRPDRVNLADVRRGQLERLRTEIATSPDRRPDIGEPVLHPTAGAVIVGARNFLIAANADLASADVNLARAIARRVRQSSGGFHGVKALGLFLPSRGVAQVSMNLTDFERIPVLDLARVLESEARRLGTRVVSREIIGMVPRAAYRMAPRFYEECANFRPALILEDRLGL